MGKGSPTPEDEVNQLMKRSDVTADLARLYVADNYICKLSSELKKVAKKELREDDAGRSQALVQMRDWIRKSDFILNCRLDSNFLLRFLRQKKFSVPMAQETLLRYLIMRQEHPLWYRGTSMYDPAVLDLINRGVAFALPKRDKQGRRVLYTIGGNIDPNYHTAEDVMKAIMVSFESLLEDEENQIRGFSYVLDEGGITLSHLSLWNPTEMNKVFGVCERNMPMRHKQLNFVGLPTICSIVFECAKSLMTPKLRNRIKMHKDYDGLNDVIDRKILPKEFGGEMPMAEMIELYKAEVRDKQARLLALDHMKIDMNLMKKTGNDPRFKGKNGEMLNNNMGVVGSFKRLEID